MMFSVHFMERFLLNLEYHMGQKSSVFAPWRRRGGKEGLPAWRNWRLVARKIWLVCREGPSPLGRRKNPSLGRRIWFPPSSHSPSFLVTLLSLGFPSWLRGWASSRHRFSWRKRKGVDQLVNFFWGGIFWQRILLLWHTWGERQPRIDPVLHRRHDKWYDGILVNNSACNIQKGKPPRKIAPGNLQEW